MGSSKSLFLTLLACTSALTGCSKPASSPPEEPTVEVKPPEVRVETKGLPERALFRVTITQVRPDDYVEALAFSPDGKLLAVGHRDGSVHLLDSSSGATVGQAEGHQDATHSLVFTPDGRTLVSGGSDAVIRTWLKPNWQPGGVLEAPDKISSVAVARDGALLAAGGVEPRVRLWDLQAGEAYVLETNGALVNSLAFSPDEKLLAAALDDGHVAIWNVATRKVLARVRVSTGPALSTAFLADGSRLALGTAQGEVVLCDSRTGKILTTRRIQHPKDRVDVMYALASDPKKPRFAVGGELGKVRVLDQNGQELLTLSGHTGPVRALAFSPDGSRLASGGSDASIVVWDVSGHH